MSDVKELTVIERAAIALGADEGEKQLIALAKKYTDITDIKNPAGRTQCHAAAMELSNARIHVDKTGKAAREDANAFQKAVIAEVTRRVAIIKPEEERLLAIRDKWDAEREAERQAKLAAEKARVDAIRAKINAMRNRPAEMVGMPSDEIGEIANVLSETVIDLATYMEFAGEAQVERDHVVTKLREMQAAQAAVEQEQARLAEERAQLERDRAAVAEHARKEAAARAEREAAEREQRRIAEEEQRLIQERAAAAMREQQEAHERRMAAERAEIQRQQDELNRAREVAEAAAKLEADHAEGLEENARIDAVRDAADHAARAEVARQAELSDKARRERVQFELNGPDAGEMIEVLASHYEVDQQTVLNWINRWVWAQVDIAA